MTGVVRDYILALADGQQYPITLAKEVAPGLMVYRLPDEMNPQSPQRWRIGHDKSGLAVADAMRREDAVKGAELLGTLADWRQDVDTLRSNLNPNSLFIKLSWVDCVQPASERMPGDVTRNGTYTDDDIRAAATEFADLNALQLLNAMAHSVPWMGLDTEDFNEAHNRIVELANAA